MLPWQANIGRAHLISSLDLSPDSHVSKLPLWELCMEYDSCKRWTLSFAHSSTDCSQIWASTTCWICDWRKLCHNKGCTAHAKFGLHVFWTQTCKHWFIKELTKVWNHDLYGSKKSRVTGHLTLQGIMMTCGALLEISVLIFQPHQRFGQSLIVFASCRMRTHLIPNKRRTGSSISCNFLPWAINCARLRCKCLDFLQVWWAVFFPPMPWVMMPLLSWSNSTRMVNMWNSHLLNALMMFLHVLYKVQILRKLRKCGLNFFGWPVDLENDDPTDWGITWFELAVSFYLSTNCRFPVNLHGAGNKSVYAEYDSDEALILPGHQRSAVLQSICLRNMMQNLITVLDEKIFPSCQVYKCRTLIRIAMKSVVAGLPRRPCIPNAAEAMTYVSEYISKLKGVALDQPIFCRNIRPCFVIDRIHKLTSAERHNLYAAMMKRKRKQHALERDDN